MDLGVVQWGATTPLAAYASLRLLRDLHIPTAVGAKSHIERGLFLYIYILNTRILQEDVQIAPILKGTP